MNNVKSIFALPYEEFAKKKEWFYGLDCEAFPLCNSLGSVVYIVVREAPSSSEVRFLANAIGHKPIGAY